MKNIRLLLSITAFFTLLSYLANAQGCSDAGFCTINSFKPNNSSNLIETKNQFKVGVSFGKADYSILVFGSYVEYNRQLNNNFSIDAKVTSVAQNGNNVSSFGLSDIYLNANYKISEKVKFAFGAKIPLADGNKIKDNLSLPMDYQSSLGTVDLILGLGYDLNKIQLVAALQQPLTQNNNGFMSEKYPSSSKLSSFQSTNKFKRSGDFLLRVSYPITLNNKLKLTPSLLPIYHLANDKYTDALGSEKEITGSQGLTFNGNVYFDYEMNTNSAIQLNLGVPFVVRTKKPDGLTRSFVINVEYRVKF